MYFQNKKEILEFKWENKMQKQAWLLFIQIHKQLCTFLIELLSWAVPFIESINMEMMYFDCFCISSKINKFDLDIS